MRWHQVQNAARNQLPTAGMVDVNHLHHVCAGMWGATATGGDSRSALDASRLPEPR